VKTPVLNRCFVIAKKIEVPTKKPKTAQKSTNRHKPGQTVTKWDKKTQNGTKFPNLAQNDTKLKPEIQASWACPLPMELNCSQFGVNPPIWSPSLKFRHHGLVPPIS
jgi:hypothetical protein